MFKLRCPLSQSATTGLLVQIKPTRWSCDTDSASPYYITDGVREPNEMTSPFPPTSSPFPFPSFSPFPNPSSVPAQASQTPGGSQLPLAPPASFATGSTAAPNANGQLFNPNFLGSGAGTGPSPLPFSIPSNPASTTPFPLTSLSFPASTSPFGGLGGPGAGANALGAGNGIGGGTPWMGGTGFTPTPNFGQNVSGLTLPGGNFDGLGGLPQAEDNDEVGLMRRGLDAAGAIVDRLMVVLGEIGRMEQGLFEPVPGGGQGSEDSGAEGRNGTDGAHAASGTGQGGRSEGMQVGVGGLSRIECECLACRSQLQRSVAVDRG